MVKRLTLGQVLASPVSNEVLGLHIPRQVILWLQECGLHQFLGRINLRDVVDCI